MTRHFARAKKGQRAFGKCPYNRGKNITLIGAICRRQPLSDRYIRFLGSFYL